MGSEPGTPEVSFKILGSLEGWSAGVRLRLGGPIQERVLVVLLLEPNRVVPVTRLVEAAWDEDPPATAVHQIRKVAADLRRRIPGGASLLRTDGAGYLIALDDDQLDLSMFTVRTRRAREAAAAGLRRNAADQLRAALELWRGPLMSGTGGAVIETAATMLEERRLTAAEQLFELRLGLGEAADLVGDLRQTVAANPLRETFRAQLMLALYRSGRQAEALEEFARVREILSEEMGIDPGSDLADLHERILRNSPGLTAAPQGEEPAPGGPPAAADPVAEIPAGEAAPCSLPYDLPDFTGRETELKQLLDGAADSSHQGARIIAVEGMGGSGKTVLAVRAAYLLAGSYPDGQLSIDLRGFTQGQHPLEPEEALDVLLRTMGVPGDRIPDGLLSRVALWRVTTAQRRLLLLLDNAIGAAQVRPLIPSSPGCLVLVTSRVRLTGIDGAQPFPIGLLSAGDSTALLGRTLGADRVSAEPEAVGELVQLCGQLPLALRVSVGRLRNRPRWTIGYLVDRLRDQTRTLNELNAGDRSVAASLGLSYLVMEPERQTAFRLLGFHPGSDVDVWTAAALLGRPVDEAAEILEDLLDVHLVGERELGRYVFHDLVRSFAHSLRDESTRTGDEQAVLRLMDYYLQASETASLTLYPGRIHLAVTVSGGHAELPRLDDDQSALAWFDRERGNLLEAVRVASRCGLNLHAACLPRNLGQYLQNNGYLTDSFEVERMGVDAARQVGDPLLLRMTLTNLSVALWQLCRFREGLAYVEQALELAEEIGDRHGEAGSLSRLGAFHNSLGEYADGLRCLERALVMHQELDSLREEASALVNISSAASILGCYDRAVAAARRALELYQGLGEVNNQPLALVNEANALLGLGEDEAAMASLLQAQELCKRLGTPTTTDLVLTRLADAHQRAGRYEEAYDYASQALDLFWTDHSPAHLSLAENVLGRIHNRRREYRQAFQHHQRAHQLASAIEYRLGMAEALQGMGAAQEELGAVGEAARYRAEAREVFGLMGVPEEFRRPF